MARGPSEAAGLGLAEVVTRLAPLYDAPVQVGSADPFELILAENVAYLADDSRREAAMSALRESVGLTPRAILQAPIEALKEPAEQGILAEQSVKKMRRAAEIAVERFGGDLSAVLDLPLARAKSALRAFPGIGEPGAEKILLLCGRHAFLAPDSNALRVLVRLGLCPAEKSYSATYRKTRRLGEEELGGDIPRTIAARHALRRHGQRRCRNKGPECGSCVLAAHCPSAEVPSS